MIKFHSCTALLISVLLAACAADPGDVGDEANAAELFDDEIRNLIEHGEIEDLTQRVDDDQDPALSFVDQEQSKLRIGPIDERKPVTDSSVAPYSSTVIPGAFIDSTGRQRPLPKVGYAVATSKDLHIPKGYNDLLGYGAHLHNYDYAVVRLPKPLGRSAGIRPLAIARNPQGGPASMIAYHADRCERADNMCANAQANGQYTGAGRVGKVHSGWFEHDVDTMSGSSGTGISASLATNEPIYAIHIAENERYKYNVALLLNEQNLAEIKAWAGLR